MNANVYNKYSDNFVSRVLEITAITAVVFYIVFSITKRFIENEKVFWLPLILFAANFFILVEILYMVKKKKLVSNKKEFRNLIGQIILNLCFVIFIATYLF